MSGDLSLSSSSYFSIKLIAFSATSSSIFSLIKNSFFKSLTTPIRNSPNLWEAWYTCFFLSPFLFLPLEPFYILSFLLKAPFKFCYFDFNHLSTSSRLCVNCFFRLYFFNLKGLIEFNLNCFELGLLTFILPYSGLQLSHYFHVLLPNQAKTKVISHEQSWEL